MTPEPAPWSAYRDVHSPYGFASFDVEPSEPGGMTSITITQYGAQAGAAASRVRSAKQVRDMEPP